MNLYTCKLHTCDVAHSLLVQYKFIWILMHVSLCIYYVILNYQESSDVIKPHPITIPSNPMHACIIGRLYKIMDCGTSCVLTRAESGI